MLTLDIIHQATKRIKPYIKVTPTIYDDYLSEFCKKQVFLKLENFQITHAFKIRGNANTIPGLSDKKKHNGLITASTGNHGLGLAYISTKLGIDAIIVVPTFAPKIKIEIIEKYGGKVVVHGSTFLEASEYAHKIADEEKRQYLGSFDSESFFAGNATIFLEMLSEVSDIDTIIAPIGGGGLLSGVAFVAKAINPKIKVYGVQSKIVHQCMNLLRAEAQKQLMRSQP